MLWFSTWPSHARRIRPLFALASDPTRRRVRRGHRRLTVATLFIIRGQRRALAAGGRAHHGRGAWHRQRGGRLPAAAVQVGCGAEGGGEGGVAPRVSSRLLFFGGRVGTLGTLRSALCDMPCTGVRRASHWRRGMRRGARARGIDGPGRAGKGATCGLLTAGTFTALSCWVCRNVFSPPSPPPIPLCLLCPTVPLGRYYAHLTSDAVPLPTPPAPPAPGVTYTLFGVPQVVRVARRHRRRFGSWP